MKERIKKPRDWTLRDFIDYANYRACDGNWSVDTALCICEWYSTMPRFFKKKWWEENKHLILNCNSETYVNIKTGQVIPECPYEIEIDK